MQTSTSTASTASSSTSTTSTPFKWTYVNGVTKYGYDAVFDTVYILALIDNGLNTYFGV